MLFSGISGGHFKKLFLKSRRGEETLGGRVGGGGRRIAEWSSLPAGTRKDVKPDRGVLLVWFDAPPGSIGNESPI